MSGARPFTKFDCRTACRLHRNSDCITETLICQEKGFGVIQISAQLDAMPDDIQQLDDDNRPVEEVHVLAGEAVPDDSVMMWRSRRRQPRQK